MSIFTVFYSPVLLFNILTALNLFDLFFYENYSFNRHMFITFGGLSG